MTFSIKNMGFINRYLLVIILFVQFLLIFFSFKKTILNPTDYILADKWDGIKNYYTYQAYLNQPEHLGYSKLEMMNYPYGEYQFYTDDTPLLATILKLVSTHIYNVSSYGTFIYNLFILSGIILSSFFLFKILIQLSIHPFLNLIFSICLPWINPQIMRFMPGHLNLTFAWLMLAAIFLLFKIYNNYYAEKKNLLLILWLLSLIYLSAFIHAYHIILLLVFVSGFLFLWAVKEFFYSNSFFKILKYWFITSIVPLFLFLITIRIIDSFFKLRNPQTEGYNFIEWKLNFSALFTPYPFNKIKFIISNLNLIPYESSAYLGSFGLFLLFLLLISIFLKKIYFKDFKPLFFENRNGMFLTLLLASSIVSLFISLGPEYYTDDYKITNYLNPFFYFEKFTQQVTQFRCLGRFVWIFFWAFNFCMLSIATYLINQRKWFFNIAIYLFTIFCMVDTYYSIKFFKQSQFLNLLNHKYFDSDLKILADSINSSNYQAILTIPFYHSGYNSENYRYTIDPDDQFCTRSYQLSTYTNLPLIPAKLGRTPLAHVKPLFSIFSDSILDKSFTEKITYKPILVLYDSTFYNSNSNWPAIMDPARQPAITAFENGKGAIKKYKMKRIASSGSLQLLEWRME